MRPKQYILLFLIMCYWFMISFMTNSIAPLIPGIIANFELQDLTLAGFLPSSFFVAYAVMSIPAGILVDRYGEKVILMTGFAMPLLGALLFACNPSYGMLLTSCFIIGLGVAMLQTVMNPLQRKVGGERNYAFVAQMGQFVFGLGSLAAPLVYRYVMSHVERSSDPQGLMVILAKLTPTGLPWVSIYWIFVFLLILMLLSAAVTRFPSVESTPVERVGAETYKHLFGRRLVWIYFLGILCYIATEQGVTVFMSTFLERYHDVPAHEVGIKVLSNYWIAMVCGCLVGMILLRFIDGRYILRTSTILAGIALAVALFGSTTVSMVAFVAIGFCLSVMFSLIFSLALNSFTEHHGALAGVLCSGMVGGALGPLVVSALADATGSLKVGMTFIFLTIGYMCFVGFVAKPLISNKTISLK